MNWKKLLLIAAVAGAFTFAAAAKSEAGVRVGIGIGFPIGYGYSCGYPYAGYYPYAYGYPYGYRLWIRVLWLLPGGLWRARSFIRGRWWSTATGTALSTTALVRRRGGRFWDSLEIGSFEEAFELADARRVTHLAQRLGFDLADALAGDPELPAHFLQRAAVAVDQAEAQFQHLALALGQGLEHVADLVLQQRDSGHVGGIFRGLVLDEIAEIGVLAVADRRLQVRSAAAPSSARRARDRPASAFRPRFLPAWVRGRIPGCSCFCTRISLLIVSIMCTGMRMVRAWSAMERVMAWRIHHVA